MSRLSSFRVLRLCRPERSASLSSCDAAGVRCRNPLDSVSRAGGNPEAPKGFGALRALVCPRGLDPRLRGKRGLEVRFQMGRARVSSPSPIASADCVSLIGSCVFPGRLAIIRRVAARLRPRLCFPIQRATGAVRRPVAITRSGHRRRELRRARGMQAEAGSVEQVESRAG